MNEKYDELKRKISILNFSIKKGEEDCNKSGNYIKAVFGNLRLRSLELEKELSIHLEISPEAEKEHE